jgi:hypothetical protein
MSGQTRPNGRRSHITLKRVRSASIEHTYQPTESQKCRGRDCNGRIYGLFGRVCQDKPSRYEDTSWIKTMKTTFGCWEMKNEASASVVNGCVGKKCNGITMTVSLVGTNASRGTSGISLRRRLRERSRIASLHEEFYLVCMYDILQNSGLHKDTLA